MVFQTIVEQRRNDEHRNQYDPVTGLFHQTEYKSLLFQRDYTGIYGWLLGYGSPPEHHLDVFTLTDTDYELGAIIKVKVIGVFIRNDGDNKFLAVELTREEDDFADLPKEDQRMLFNVYPNLRVGEGWFGQLRAMELIEESRLHNRTDKKKEES